MTSVSTITLGLKSDQAAAPAAQGREVLFTEPTPAAMVAAAQSLAGRGYTRFVLKGAEAPLRAVAQGLRDAHPGLTEIPGGPSRESEQGTVYLYPGSEDEALREALMGHLEARHAAVVAPITATHSSRLPLFLISVPKAGTHLLYELARALGYEEGTVCPDVPLGGTWYCIEYSNSHTKARDFLVDTTRRSAFGNKHHPFFRSPALFIYRHPYDILVSEANWFHQPRNSPLAGYLSGLDLPERLSRLADDPWLLGTLRDRVGAFIPWLDFPNVIPISFEELVGSNGGGSEQAQLDLIWSIQLKLQVGGSPADIARKVFNPDSPTFTEGRIGAWAGHRTPALMACLNRLLPDYLEAYGYALDAQGEGPSTSTRVGEFRRRPLRLPRVDFGDIPIAVEVGYLEHNIVLVRNRFYAVPQAIGQVDLTREVHRLTGDIETAATLESAKLKVLRKHMPFGGLWNWWKRLRARIRGHEPT